MLPGCCFDIHNPFVLNSAAELKGFPLPHIWAGMYKHSPTIVAVCSFLLQGGPVLFLSLNGCLLKLKNRSST